MRVFVQLSCSRLACVANAKEKVKREGGRRREEKREEGRERNACNKSPFPVALATQASLRLNEDEIP